MPKNQPKRKPATHASPARKPAAKIWVLYKGKKNPDALMLHSDRGAIEQTRRWLAGHFPGQKLQVGRLARPLEIIRP